MAAEWPTLAVVFLLASLLLPTGGGGVRPRDDDGQQQPSWCQKEECKCEQDDENRLSVKCTFSGEKIYIVVTTSERHQSWCIPVAPQVGNHYEIIYIQHTTVVFLISAN
ncbi:hypothetical protein ACI65C_011202 [Semiaphis heraclei]